MDCVSFSLMVLQLEMYSHAPPDVVIIVAVQEKGKHQNYFHNNNLPSQFDYFDHSTPHCFVYVAVPNRNRILFRREFRAHH